MNNKEDKMQCDFCHKECWDNELQRVNLHIAWNVGWTKHRVCKRCAKLLRQEANLPINRGKVVFEKADAPKLQNCIDSKGNVYPRLFEREV